MQKYLTDNLRGETFSTAKCAVSFRRSEQVEVFDESIVPEQYLAQKVTFTPDKNAIKSLLKAGHTVGGCRLVEKLNPQIK